MNSQVIVQKASAEDFEAMQNLFRKMFDIYYEDQDVNYPYTEKGIRYLRDRIENGFAFVAKSDDKVVGFLTGSFEKALDFKTYDRYGFIENMCVSEEYRRMGIGNLLISAFVNFCRENGIGYIHTGSDANQAMMNFYTGAGFKISGVEYTMKI